MVRFLWGRWKEAVDDCSTALQIDPKYVKSYHRRALAFQNLNSLDEAHKDLKEALELDPYNKTIKNDLIAVEKLLPNLVRIIKFFSVHVLLMHVLSAQSVCFCVENCNTN